jgi:hypothetical protein
VETSGIGGCHPRRVTCLIVPTGWWVCVVCVGFPQLLRLGWVTQTLSSSHPPTVTNVCSVRA